MLKQVNLYTFNSKFRILFHIIILISIVIFFTIFSKNISRINYNFKKYSIAVHIKPNNSYLAYYKNHIGHIISYHKLKNSYEVIKNADVIFLGSSNCGFALNEQILNNFFNKLNLKYYVLCFGGDRLGFAQELIKKLNLKPKFAIVIDDDFFSGPHFTEYSKRAISFNLFDAVKYVFNFEWTFYSKRFLHSIIPHIRSNVLNRDSSINTWIEYRSYSNGIWYVIWPDHYEKLPAKWGLSKDLTRSIELAKKFNNSLKFNNTKIILAEIKTLNTFDGATRSIAKEILVPLVPLKQNLNYITFDGSHMNVSSAKEYTINLVNSLSEIIK